MKQLKHPATIIATLALFVALASGAYASGLINGSKIKNHSIAAKKLTSAAVKSLKGAPGGEIFTWNATAVSGSPQPSTLGTFLGVTYGATCTTTSGNAQFGLFVKTPNGAWDVDFGSEDDDNGTTSDYTAAFNVAAGTLSSFSTVGTITADAGGHVSDNHLELTQLFPQPGEMAWHGNVSTNNSTQTCHFSIAVTPETISAIPAARREASRATTRLQPLLRG